MQTCLYDTMVEVRRPTFNLAFVLTLAVYLAVLTFEAWHLSLTADEPSHWMSGYMYWLGDDTLYPSDAPPLTRILSGWVPRAQGVPLHRDSPVWAEKNAYALGATLLNSATAAAAHRYLFFGRLPFLVFPVLLILVAWTWARQALSEPAALLVVVCMCAEPTITGHAALMTSDVPAAAMSMLAAWVGWRYWNRPDAAHVLVLIAAVAAAALTKFSLLLLVPLAAIAIAIRGPRALGLTTLATVLYTALLASYQFHARPPTHAETNEFVHWALGLRPRRIYYLPALLPWPQRLLEGMRFIGSADHYGGFGGSMLGNAINGPQPWYFPLAWALKFPIALQMWTAAGLAALAARLLHRASRAVDAFVWLPAAVFAAAAIRSQIHLGFRHFLPVLPFLILGGGFAIERWWHHRAARLTAFALAAWTVGAAVFIFPNGISYFNEWIGGPSNGWRYLADSNVDWCQNLPELARYVSTHRVAKLKLFYFGMETPSHYLAPERYEPMPAPYVPSSVKGPRFEPEPGTYAISVNVLAGFAFPPAYRDYLAYFRDKTPVGRAGYSILIYEVH